MPGHVGTIYQGLNGRLDGRGDPRTLYLWRDATVWSAASQEKLRRPEKKGHAYAYRQVLERGAPPQRVGEEWPAYVSRLRVEGLARGWLLRVRHPGNYVYSWGISPGQRAARVKTAGPWLPYPKACCGRERVSPWLWVPEGAQGRLPLGAA
jgi:hypothetical protein